MNDLLPQADTLDPLQARTETEDEMGEGKVKRSKESTNQDNGLSGA
jgi:hypothetical protein